MADAVRLNQTQLSGLRSVIMSYAAPLMATFIVASACAHATGAPVNRFHDPASITADPTGLRRDTTVRLHPPGPSYPRTEVRKGRTAAQVVAYVIDTTGHVEFETITFLNSTPGKFSDAVCAFVPKQKFEPFIVANQKWRVLLVQMFGFNTWRNLDDRSMIDAADALVKKSQEEFSTSPISQVVARLETLPHCGK